MQDSLKIIWTLLLICHRISEGQFLGDPDTTTFTLKTPMEWKLRLQLHAWWQCSAANLGKRLGTA